MTEVVFTAEVLAAGGGGHAVVVPKEIAAKLSGRRVPVVAHVDGVEYHSRVAVYGGQVYLGLRQELLRRIGRQAGDTVEVRLAEGSAPEPAPALSEPPELVAALADTRPRGRRTPRCPPSISTSSGPGSPPPTSPRPARTGWPGRCGGSVASGSPVARVQQGVLDHLGERGVDPVLAAGHVDRALTEAHRLDQRLDQ
jgi:hypothetical protein